MSRTNIDIDDELVQVVMDRYGCRTKRAAVDLALRKVVGGRGSKEGLLALRGSGWDGDLEAMRGGDPDEP